MGQANDANDIAIRIICHTEGFFQGTLGRKKGGTRQGRVFMRIMEENVVLCGARSYEKKYYFNQQFAALPEDIRKELQIMCVLYTEDVGGILTMEFDKNGSLEFRVEADEGDYLFDEIGSALKIKQYQLEKRELLESLELFYRVFFLGEKLP